MFAQETVALVQSLKGASASVLWALQLAGRPLTSREIQRFTRYSEGSVRPALRTLEELGCIVALASNGPWTLASAWKSDPARPNLPTNSDTPSAISGTPTTNSDAPSTNFDTPSTNYGPPRFSNGGGRGGSFESLKEETEKPLPPPPEEEGTESVDTPQIADSPQIAEPWSREKNLEAARQEGIEEPGLSRIAGLHHVTPEYIRAHARRAVAEGRSLGAAVYRMEHRWVLPKEQPTATPAVVLQQAPTALPVGEGLVPRPHMDLRSAPLGVRPEGYEIVDLDEQRRQRELRATPRPIPEGEAGVRFQANLQALLEWRGAEQVADRLARLPHVTPELVREHYRQAYENNQDVITALYRIEHNEPLPETWIHEQRDPAEVQEEIRRLAEKLRAGGGGRMYGGSRR